MRRPRVVSSKYSWIKLLVALLLIASVIVAGIIGYRAFNHELPPIVGSVSFIVIVGLFIWFITILRKRSMRYRKPSFTLVFWSLLGITLVCTFAGVQPLSAYKDSLFDKAKTTFNSVNNGQNTNQVTPSSKSISNKTPHGTYTATAMGIKQTITFSGDTITRYDDIGGKAILKYDYTEPNSQLPAITASEAVAIWLQDITIGTWTLVPFKYIPDQDIVVLSGVPYYK